VTELDSGRYDCLYRGQLVSSYHIAVDTHRYVCVGWGGGGGGGGMYKG
jgi:hypothetical protein